MLAVTLLAWLLVNKSHSLRKQTIRRKLRRKGTSKKGPKNQQRKLKPASNAQLLTSMIDSKALGHKEVSRWTYLQL
jgi:hypothetical protein